MEIRLFTWSGNDAVPHKSYVGVFLQKLPNGRLHMGFLYARHTGGAYVLHLKQHRKLVHDTPDRGMICIICNVEPLRLPAISAFASDLLDANSSEGIPFGFSSPDQDWFSVGGKLQTNDQQIGLTCSHFVLAFYRSVGIPLVKLETWKHREEDELYYLELLNDWISLAKKTKTKKHLELIRKEIEKVRCRPVEVGGAAMANEYPCDFTTAVANAIEIEKLLATEHECSR